MDGRVMVLIVIGLFFVVGTALLLIGIEGEDDSTNKWEGEINKTVFFALILVLFVVVLVFVILPRFGQFS